jgi:hypothetical protein
MKTRRFRAWLRRGLFAAGACVAATTSCTGSETGPIFTGTGTGASAGTAGAASGSGGRATAGSGASAGAGAGNSAGRAGSSANAGSAGTNTGGAGGKASGAGASTGGRSSAGKGGTGAVSGAAGASDAGESQGGAASGCADLPLCEDFESYDVGQTPNGIWQKQGGGSATVDTTRPFRGEQSVHLVTGESEGGRVWLHTETDEVFPTRHFFGRFWLYLDALPTTEVHWDMIEAQGTADEPAAWDDPFEIALRYGGQLDENLLANFETPGSYSGDGPRTDCAKFSETRMPFGRWACMEWELDSDAEVMRFWLDGDAVEDLEVRKVGTQCISDGTDGVWSYPTFESLNIGWREWWEAGSRELWIDEIAVANERIGCD